MFRPRTCKTKIVIDRTARKHLHSTIEIDFMKKQAAKSSQHVGLGSLPVNQVTLHRGPAVLPITVFPPILNCSN